MAKKFNGKRAFLPNGEQNRFINKLLEHISVSQAAELCNLSERTIRDWRREVLSMDYIALRKISRKTGVPLSPSLELRERYWYVNHGASAGAMAVLKKYGRVGGDPEYRKRKWFEWWEREGKYKDGITTCKPVRKPRYTKELAEFVGIVLGDGGITKCQLTISLHHKDDKPYSRFVAGLIKKLFNVPVAIYHYPKKSINNLVVSRSELVRFCTEKLGLKQGNKVKQQVDIPGWIKQNKQYSIACVRGLVDTDGSVFTHRYRVNGKEYRYRKLAFTSASKPILYSVYKILQDLDLNVRIAQGKDVRIDSISDMKKYFKIIGSHNPKHLKRYKN
ncbi:MAG TPA: hypothetical protein ENI04_00670 [Candidatus Wildermuthbacteria bacterium]|nr:hypothetical protein [Candidatus Wildermuthbacteria bacterium]